MTKNTISKEDKSKELTKYRDLVLATIDYYIENQIMDIQYLKAQTIDHFEKGRLTKLKQWFRDLTEMQIEIRDLKFNEYLRNKTGLDIDIFKDYFERIDQIVERGKITTDSQFYDVKNMVDYLCQTDPIDDKQIDILNNLLIDFERKK